MQSIDLCRAECEAAGQKYLWTSAGEPCLKGLQGIGVVGACIKFTVSSMNSAVPK
jgi:hypothetical protein